MQNPFQQGSLDSLCSIYALVNTTRIVNKATEDEMQELFNQTVLYLSKKKKLKNAIIGGVHHKDMLLMLKEVVQDSFQWKTCGNGFQKVSIWWDFALDFLKTTPQSAIILSTGGKENHLTVIKSMTNKTMLLFDSSQIRTIRKSACRLMGYPKDDKYVIFPAQSFLCWRN